MPDVISTRPLLDKLGVKPEYRVAVINIEDAEFRGLLSGRTQDITEGEPLTGSNLVFLGVDDGPELLQLPALRQRIVSNGGIWVVFRKGRLATIRDIDVMAAGKSSGLIDNKVVAFSASHTSIRLVIPLALR